MLARFDSVGRHQFSKKASDEVVGYAEKMLSTRQGPVDEMKIDFAAIPQFVNEVLSKKDMIDRGSRCLIFEEVDGITTLKGQAALAWIISNVLGEPMVQNHLGRRIVEVYDREGKTMQQGARYHQSRQGDNPHTDSTSDPEAIDYFVLSCAAPALEGGETIIVDGFAVYEKLQRLPDVLATLRQPFWFENRGMAAEDKLFQMPVVSLDDRGEPRIRYLRPYMESAHRKANQPLSSAQVAALDAFDTIIGLSELQHRTMLRRGETLVAVDTQVLHARTYFVDRGPPRTIDMETERLEDINRYLLRVWLKQGPSRAA